MSQLPAYGYTTRYGFTAGAHLQAWTSQGKPLHALPQSVGRNQLICWLDARQDPPEEGEHLTELRLEVESRRFEIPGMTVHRCVERKEGGWELHLHGDDCTETRHQLWELCYLMRSSNTPSDPTLYDEFNLPKIPARGLYTEEARQERLDFVREQTGCQLASVSQIGLDPRKLVSNIEALIGSVEVPVGIAGPLHIRGEHAQGLFYAPMATSEGALVASTTRGATALSRSGGVAARVIEQRMMRVPVFVFGDMANALFFAEWVKDHFDEMATEARRYSNYASLRAVRPYVFGRSVHVHLIYRTGDAAGQNMTTTCSWQICQWILKSIQGFEGLRVDNFLIDANLSNDKKVTYQTFLNGRGIRVVAEALLLQDICERILKVSPRQLVSAYNYCCAGSIAGGMVGMNINVANVIAALFTALGQDIACVHESALAQLHMELTETGDVYCTMMLPSLVIGTVGGGTNLPQQRECLDIMGCAGPGKAHKLAEIMAGYCLALDLSTLSAIASDQFARAHEKLGRNRPVDHLKLGQLDAPFFDTIIAQTGLHTFSVQEAAALSLKMTGSSIITELTSHKVNKLLGHFPFRLKTSGGQLDVMVKIKPLDAEVILMLNSLAAMCNPRLAQEFNRCKQHLGFSGCHLRELIVMSQQDPRFQRHAPITYGVLADPEREAFVLIQEHLTWLELMDTADDTSSWSREHIEAAIRGIAEVHSIWLGREEELKQQPWLVDYPHAQGMKDKLRLWELLGAHAREEFPEWFSEEDLSKFRSIVHTLEHWWPDIETMPRTLVHNDFNPRNIAFRRLKDGSLRLCAYDWELATLHLPQHDLVELLGFTLYDPVDPSDVEHYIELHRQELERHSGQSLDPVRWRRGYTLALMDMMVTRMPLYMMAHTFRHYGFMERVYRSFRDLWSHEEMVR